MARRLMRRPNWPTSLSTRPGPAVICCGDPMTLVDSSDGVAVEKSV